MRERHCGVCGREQMVLFQIDCAHDLVCSVCFEWARTYAVKVLIYYADCAKETQQWLEPQL